LSECWRTWRSTRTFKRQAIGQPPVAADEAAYLAGADVYKQHCASCHGLPGQTPTDYSTTMYPDPPQLFRGKGVTDDPASETYWKTANGIRLDRNARHSRPS
jgi:mono/diheme cytochrome c family protein